MGMAIYYYRSLRPTFQGARLRTAGKWPEPENHDTPKGLSQAAQPRQEGERPSTEQLRLRSAPRDGRIEAKKKAWLYLAGGSMVVSLIVAFMVVKWGWSESEEIGGCEITSGAQCRGADLSYADLIDADLSYADLSYADLVGADLIGADLWYADLSNANLAGANFTGADLSNANLAGGLGQPTLTGANLCGAKFAGDDTLAPYSRC